MWVDGIDIVRDEEVKHCYTINECVFLTDEVGKILFAFDTKTSKEITKEDKTVAQTYIFRYDVIKKIQESCS